MSDTERSSICSRVRIVLNAADEAGRRAEPWAYATLRVCLGLTLLTHGVPKLLHLPHGGSSDAYANLVDEIGGKLHLPFAAALAMMVTLTETLGAAALVLGLATRLAALAIVIDLLVAVFGVHLPKWDWTEGGAEYPLLMATVAAFIAVRGGGSHSLNA